MNKEDKIHQTAGELAEALYKGIKYEDLKKFREEALKASLWKKEFTCTWEEDWTEKKSEWGVNKRLWGLYRGQQDFLFTPESLPFRSYISEKEKLAKKYDYAMKMVTNE